MKIYLLYRTNEIDYDEYLAKVIVAKNKKHARKIANKIVGDEGHIWENKTLVKCEIVSTDTAGVVLNDFHAG